MREISINGDYCPEAVCLAEYTVFRALAAEVVADTLPEIPETERAQELVDIADSVVGKAGLSTCYTPFFILAMRKLAEFRDLGGRYLAGDTEGFTDELRSLTERTDRFLGAAIVEGHRASLGGHAIRVSELGN